MGYLYQLKEKLRSVISFLTYVKNDFWDTSEKYIRGHLGATSTALSFTQELNRLRLTFFSKNVHLNDSQLHAGIKNKRH